MQRSKYDDVLLIGFGNIYKNLLKYLIAVKEQWGFHLNVIEHEMYPTSRIESVCVDSNVRYSRITDKNELCLYLHGFHTETLIISAGNKYLFPQDLIEQENVTIINFHNALLPAYPGRNAPSWAIYNDEKYAGATWHMVTADVDAGGILWQRACELSPDCKAYEVVRMIMELAYQGFLEIAESLFLGRIESMPQKMDISERKMYYAKDIPGGGIVKFTDDPWYIYRVLRATDFGFNPVFPKIKLVMEDGETYVIKRYNKEKGGEEKEGEPLKRYYLKLDDEYVLKLDVSISQWGGAELVYAFEHPTNYEYNCLRQYVGWELVSDYQIRQAMEHSIVVTARVESTLVGFARMITDGGMMSFIVDVMIHPEYQRYGIGANVVKLLLDVQKEQLLDGEIGYVSVMVTTGNEGFYKTMGFVERPNFMLGSGMTLKLVANKINKYER